MRQKNLLVAFIISLGLLIACNNPKSDKTRSTVNDAQQKELSQDETKYETLKKDYQLFGVWTITNSLSKTSYAYEIYSKGDQFIGVSKLDGVKFETLKKEGNKYIVEGNRFGEYYKVDNQFNMTLFDQDGDLTSSGYTAKRN